MLLTNVSDNDVFLSKYMNVAACEIIEDSNVCLLSEVDPGTVRDIMFNELYSPAFHTDAPSGESSSSREQLNSINSAAEKLPSTREMEAQTWDEKLTDLNSFGINLKNSKVTKVQ